MGMPGPQTADRYGVKLKLTAVKMSESPGVLIKDVAESLCIHPFMLSKWRKQVREGVLVGKAPKVDPESVAELKRLHEIEKKYQRLQLERDLLCVPMPVARVEAFKLPKSTLPSPKRRSGRTLTDGGEWPRINGHEMKPRDAD